MPISDRLATLRRRSGLVALIAGVAILGLVVPLGAYAAKEQAPVTIQILNVSDWHGNVDPVSNFGGAWNIAARWQADRQAYPSLTLTAGDDFGATPPLSGFFNEEPSVKAQRMMGIQVGTFGNHNFDRGIAHLQSMIDLAGAPTSATAPGSPYQYVSANLANRDANLTGVKDFAIFDLGGIKVGVVGLTNPEAPGLVLPGNFGTIVPSNPYPAANKAKAAAKKAGAQVVVAITHMGIRGFTNGAPFGELVDFANNVGGFDVIFGDHTDVQFSGVINNQLVHENRSFGVTYAKTLLTVAPGTGKVTNRSVTFVSPAAGSLTSSNTVCPAPPAFCDQAIVDMLIPYRQALSAQLDAGIGTSAGVFPRGSNIERRQEVATGDLIADGMRWRYGTQIGFMNSGGIRQTIPAGNYFPADHTLRRATAGYAAGPPYDLVKGDVYSVLPFNNIVTTRSVTGAQLWAMLENGVSAIDATGQGTDGRFPQISGFKFTFHFGNAVGSRVTSVQLDDGTPILADASTYTVALPNFVNAGGDGYTMLADGQGVTRELDAAVMLAYMQAFGPSFDPATYPLDRITKLP
jgi:2',3'-cyclic-nucleotide 2'-phosphodiesterase (5'-nucleotidase family)